jgi:hypothetical protein
VSFLRKKYEEMKFTEKKRMEARYKKVREIKKDKKEERRLRKKLESYDYQEEED